MRVLMTTDTIGGVWTFTIDLVKGLEKYNVEVVLATMGAPLSSQQLAQVRRLKRVSIDSSTYKLEWMPDPWKDIERAQRWMLHLNFTYNPDIIHLNSYAFDCSLFNVPVVMVGHSCVLSWWKSVKKESAPAEWNTYADIVKKGLHSTDVVVAPSHNMMMSLIENYGEFNRSQVIYNAGDVNFFKPGSKEKIIFSMGRLWDEAKNIQLLVNAARELDYPVFIAGEGHQKLDPGKNSNIHFLGKIDRKEIARWLSITSVFAMPALYEPFGLSILEAAYSGCALVLGNIRSLNEIWKNNALYCDPTNVQDLVDKLNHLMNNDGERNNLSQAALKRSSEFKLPVMAGAYFSLYNSLAGAAWAVHQKSKDSPHETIRTRY